MRYAITKATVEQVKSVGGADIKEARSTGIVFATLTREQADRLRSMGCQVTEVGQVRATVMSPPIVAPPTPVAAVPTYTPEQMVWATGLDELRAMVEPPLYGEGLNLAIIGTGIRETHQKINGRVVYSKNYTEDPMRDGFDHDTGVCSIVLAMAPLCNILNLKVLNEKGEGTEEEVALAIDDCISLWDEDPSIAPSVINLSLGGPDDGNPDNPLRVVCRAAIDRGIWVLASAGNSGPAPYSITCPACEQYVFAVGSLKYEPFTISEWSSRGPTLEGLIKPDAVMFGEDIAMASSVSDTATIAKSGTSFAAPFGSGAILLYLEGAYRQAVPMQPVAGIVEELGPVPSHEEVFNTWFPMICVKPEGAPTGKDYDYGYGLPYGPLVIRALTLKPLADIPSMLMEVVSPMVILAMMGMMIIPMAKGLRR